MEFNAAYVKNVLCRSVYLSSEERIHETCAQSCRGTMRHE